MNKMAISYGRFLEKSFWFLKLPPNFFGHLKSALQLFISIRMFSLPIFLDHWIDTITLWKKKTNKHASVIFLLAKIENFTFLEIGSLNLRIRVLLYTKSDGTVFIKILRLLEGVFPLFWKSIKFSRARSFWCVTQNLMQLTYLKSK